MNTQCTIEIIVLQSDQLWQYYGTLHTCIWRGRWWCWCVPRGWGGSLTTHRSLLGLLLVLLLLCSEVRSEEYPCTAQRVVEKLKLLQKIQRKDINILEIVWTSKTYFCWCKHQAWFGKGKGKDCQEHTRDLAARTHVPWGSSLVSWGTVRWWPGACHLLFPSHHSLEQLSTMIRQVQLLIRFY